MQSLRSLSSLLFPSVLLSTLLVPATGLAFEPHSWCVTGGPMVRNGSTYTTTNAVVNVSTRGWVKSLAFRRSL
jgi:hypothetical protein